MKKLLVAIALSFVLFISACGATPPSSGIIINRWFVPAHDVDTSHYQCFSYDAKGLCSMNMWISSSDHYNDAWFFRIENCDNRDKHGKEKCKRGDIQVSQPIFNSYANGDWVAVNRLGQ